jgi:hypothetical protein
MSIKLFRTPIVAAISLAFGTVAFAADVVVKIGHTGPLSGPNAFAGKDNENGVRMAIEEINAKKLTVNGKTLKLELQWRKNSPMQVLNSSWDPIARVSPFLPPRSTTKTVLFCPP